MYWLGRTLQVVGLLLLPLALAGNLAEFANAPIQLDLKQMLLMSALGIVIFYLGRAIQERSGR